MQHIVNHNQLHEAVKNYLQDSNVTKALLVLGHYSCGKTDVISHCLEQYGKNLKIQELQISESMAIDSSCDLLYVQTHELAEMPDKVELYGDDLLLDFKHKYRYKVNFIIKYDLPRHLIIELTSPYEGIYGSFLKLFFDDIDWYYVRDNFDDYLAWRKAAGVVKPMDINVFYSRLSRRNEAEQQLIEQGRSELDELPGYLEAGNVNKAVCCAMDACVHLKMCTLDDTAIIEHCKKIIEILKPYQDLSDRIQAVIESTERILSECEEAVNKC